MQGRLIPVRGNVPGTHGRWSVHNLHSAPWPPGRAGHGRHRTHPAPSKAGFLGSRTMSMLRPVILCRGEQGCTLEDVSPPSRHNRRRLQTSSRVPHKAKSPLVNSYCSESSPNLKPCAQSHLFHKAECAPCWETAPNCAHRSCREALSPSYFKCISLLILYSSIPRENKTF